MSILPPSIAAGPYETSPDVPARATDAPVRSGLVRRHRRVARVRYRPYPIRIDPRNPVLIWRTMEYLIAAAVVSIAVSVFVWVRFFKSSKHTPKPTVHDEIKLAENKPKK